MHRCSGRGPTGARTSERNGERSESAQSEFFELWKGGFSCLTYEMRSHHISREHLIFEKYPIHVLRATYFQIFLEVAPPRIDIFQGFLTWMSTWMYWCLWTKQLRRILIGIHVSGCVFHVLKFSCNKNIEFSRIFAGSEAVNTHLYWKFLLNTQFCGLNSC